MKLKFFLSFCLSILMACSSLHQVSKVSQTQIDQVMLKPAPKMKATKSEFACDEIPVLQNEVRDCLNSIKSGSVKYSYQFPQDSPVFLEFKESTPSATCLKTVLPKITLPRELYFLGRAEQQNEWDCYVINLNSNAGEFADIKFPWDRFNLEIQFPLSRELKTAADLQLWYAVTLLESIKADMKGTLMGSIVPEYLCQRCYIDTPWLDDRRKNKIPPVFWP